MSVYPDHSLYYWARTGGVRPFTDDNINPASIDLTLGDTIRVPMWYWRTGLRRLFWALHKRNPERFPLWSAPRQFTVYTLHPGGFVLCTSREFTAIPADAVASLYSKSSTGRRGLEHLHAGFGDPGFQGQWTWELCSCAPWPIELVAGERLMQIVLTKLHSAPQAIYNGRYQGQRGPTPERHAG